MINITVSDVLKATGGKLLCGDKNKKLDDICIDSRKIKEGDLFVPLVGNNVDGHIYIESAMKTGAATLTSIHDNMACSEKAYIRVDDTEKALQDIGVYIRDRYNMPVIGVTGSVGKTTTREMITAAIAADRPCFHTEGNFNSQQGVPITLSKMTDEYDAAVIEMGISASGEMKLLSSLVKPDIAVVTLIGVAHMEHLKSRENIRKEKLDIISSMREDGILFINGDDELLHEVKDDINCRTMTYGCGKDCDFRAENIHMEEACTIYDAVYKDKRVTVKLNTPGLHNVRNSLVGIAVAYQLGIPFEVSSKAFESFEGQRQRIIKRDNLFTIIDDTYNASPDSVKASIDVLCDIKCTGKRYAVLGDMLELGDDSVSYHRQVGEYLCGKELDTVCVVGENALQIKNVIDEASDCNIRALEFENNNALTDYLLSELKQEDIVLLKGSNGMNLKQVVNNLMK